MRISDFNLPVTLKEMYAKKKAKRKQSKPEFARFKLKFWYLDGNTSVHYSYDYTYRYPNGQQITVYDEHRGFWLLIKHIRELKAQDLFKTCVIWSNNDDCNLSTDSGRYDYCVAKSYRQRDGRTHPNLVFIENKENNLLLPLGLRERFNSVTPYKMLTVSNLVNSPELK